MKNKQSIENAQYLKTLLSAQFLGMFGVHRFINNKKKTGIIMLLTLGGLGFWWFIDIVLILTNNFRNGDGELIGYEGKFFNNLANQIFVGVMLVGILAGAMNNNDSTPNGTQDVVSNDAKIAEIKYETEGKEAVDAVYEDAVPYEVGPLGEYVIGQSPSERVLGTEEEFTTAESGEYIAGEDFKPGIYDIVAVSGSGNVQGTDLNEIMCVSNDTGIDGFCDARYDNKEFKSGDELKLSGVSVMLEPQTNDTFKIEAGTYTLNAISGSGNVQGTGLNEILCLNNDTGIDGFCTSTYENKKFSTNNELKLSGVQIQLVPKESKVLKSPAVEAEPAKTVTETLTIDDGVESCKIDDEQVDCTKLIKYEELTKQIENK